MANVYTNEATGYWDNGTWKALTDTYPDRIRLTYTVEYNSSTKKYDLKWALYGNNSHGKGPSYPNRWTYYYSCSITIDGTETTVISSSTQVSHDELLKSGTKSFSSGTSAKSVAISVTSQIYTPGQTTGLCTLSTTATIPRQPKLIVNFYGNGATSAALEGTNISNPGTALLLTQNFSRDSQYDNGLANITNQNYLYLQKTGYSSTGKWGTTTSGGYLLDHNTGGTGASLASALGKTLTTSDVSVNVYAQWSANTYTITYNANGGNGAPSSTSYTYASSGTISLSSTVPTRSGYNFLGWSTNSNATSATYSAGSAFSKAIASNTTLYAIWVSAGRQLHIRPNGGVWGGSSGYSVIAGVEKGTCSVAPPTRLGYKFVGWYKTAYGRFSNEAYGASLFTNSDSLPSVYNNTRGDTSVTHSRASNSDAGFGHQYAIKITTVGTTASPGRGGFVYSCTPVANSTYIHVFRAKAPIGTYFIAHHNTITGVSKKWLTPAVGTDNWETYAYELTDPAGATSLGTFGHIALYGGPSDKVEWYIAGNQITKFPSQDQTFTFGGDNTYVYAQWIPWGQVRISTSEGYKQTVPYVYNNGQWQLAEGYVYKDGAWKIGI